MYIIKYFRNFVQSSPTFDVDYLLRKRMLVSNQMNSQTGLYPLIPIPDTNIWMCNGPNTSWETAVSKFSASLRPAEAKIAEKLKPRLHNTSTKQVKRFLYQNYNIFRVLYLNRRKRNLYSITLLSFCLSACQNRFSQELIALLSITTTRRYSCH